MRHIALLRGINVGGNRRVPMTSLKNTFERLGFTDVRTYIQSGNVIFEAEKPDQHAIEEALRVGFGFPVDVMLRSAGEWAALASRNPYPAQAAADGTKVHIAFLHDVPNPARLDALRARTTGEELWECLGRELYLYTPRGMGQSRLSLAPLGQPVTVRNWRTVQEIGEMLRG
ncbi:hypothetical protein DAETH_27430 [Deinococcus aetherius]|uniref:DUF1697 domain-containing protein n=1 Tax=Deinococcus aetherius TaxID=200252 RepID=A0ABN6RJA6_9DEIO|nr:DUF1697 domain-containing protein [Deinococcus aetherius]BDP42774.1 hypothetical protein DAETH_27430 [Deinococcus aetherius]